MEEQVVAADEISLGDIFYILKKYHKLIILAPLVAFVLGFVINFFVLKPTYEAESRLYIMNESATMTDMTNLSQSDLMVGEMLVKDYLEILKSNRVMDASATRMGLEDLKDYDIAINATNGTRVIKIVVEGKNPLQTAKLTNILTQEFTDCVQVVMGGKNISIIDQATTPEKPSGPAKARNTLLFTMIGLMIGIGVAFVLYMMDKTIRTTEDVERYLGLPVLAKVPAYGKKKGRS